MTCVLRICSFAFKPAQPKLDSPKQSLFGDSAVSTRLLSYCRRYCCCFLPQLFQKCFFFPGEITEGDGLGTGSGIVTIAFSSIPIHSRYFCLDSTRPVFPDTDPGQEHQAMSQSPRPACPRLIESPTAIFLPSFVPSFRRPIESVQR